LPRKTATVFAKSAWLLDVFLATKHHRKSITGGSDLG
jgi:hypothetical protein